MEEGRNPEFLRGVGAGRGGGEPGAGCLGTKQEAGFLVSPPWAPPIPVNFLQFCFPTQTACSTSSPGAQRLGRLLQQQGRAFKVGENSRPSPLQSLRGPQPAPLCSLPLSSPPALSTQELAAQEVVSLLRALTPRSLLSLRSPLTVGFSPPLLPSVQPHWDGDRPGSSGKRDSDPGMLGLRHTHVPPALGPAQRGSDSPALWCLFYSVDRCVPDVRRGQGRLSSVMNEG